MPACDVLLARAPSRAGPTGRGLRCGSEAWQSSELRAHSEARPKSPILPLPARRRLHLSSSSSTGYKGVVDMGSQRLAPGGKPFKAQATCGHIRPLGYFSTRLEAAVCYSRWFDRDRRHAEARSISGESSQREMPPPRDAEAAGGEPAVGPSRSAKQRRRIKRGRNEPRVGESTAANGNNGDGTEDDEDEVSRHQ